jgi:hypothetical protein
VLSGDNRRTRIDGNASEHVQAFVDNLTFDLGDHVLADGQATERADKVVFELTPQCGSPLTFVWSRRRQRDDTGELATQTPLFGCSGVPTVALAPRATAANGH